MTENERRLQISLRMKAARHLVGHAGAKGATPMPVEDVVKLGPMLDEGITSNRLTEIEQMKVSAKRSELEAFTTALHMPDDWFAGLYPSDRGQAITDSTGALLQGAAEAALALRRAREEAVARRPVRGHR